jgi:hypothetical protein
MSVNEEDDAVLKQVAEAHGLVALALDFESETLGINGVLDFCATLDLSLSWSLQLWRMVVDDAPSVPGVPTHMYVKEASDPAWLWSGFRSKAAACQQALQDAHRDVAPLDGDVVIGEESGEGEDGDEELEAVEDEPADGDVRPDDAASDVWCDESSGSEAEDFPLMEALEELVERMAEEPAQEEEPGLPAGPSAVVPAAAPPVAAAEPPPPPPPEPRVGAWGPEKRGSNWRYQFPDDFGKIVHNKIRNSLDAHCPAHRECRINRTRERNDARPYQGRPVGQLVAWLRAKDMFANASDHKKAAVDEVGVCSLAARQDARRWACTQPGFDKVLELEGPKRTAEPDEPLGLAGK